MSYYQEKVLVITKRKWVITKRKGKSLPKKVWVITKRKWIFTKIKGKSLPRESVGYYQEKM